MTELPEPVRDRSILELAIPGSHDSFAYTLDKSAPFSQNSEGLDEIFDIIGLDKVDQIAKVHKHYYRQFKNLSSEGDHIQLGDNAGSHDNGAA